MYNEKIILYVDSLFISPYVMSVFVTLKEKGLPFEIKKIDLKAKENNQPDYANISLTQRVPTLTHGDFHLSESSAISEYLDELYPDPGVYPKDTRLKARARQMQAWIRSDLLPIREERSTEFVFGKPTNKSLSIAAQADAARLFDAADSLIKNNAKNLFNDWCIADTDLALMINRLVLNGDDVPEKLKDYALYQWQRPSVQLWVNQERSL
ncbi:MAG: glutathione transferase [Deltaproteobacteria bacterium]|nr:glutathione transferase [Deltaproteobacteria bacterium]